MHATLLGRLELFIFSVCTLSTILAMILITTGYYRNEREKTIFFISDKYWLTARPLENLIVAYLCLCF